ncbi:MAG: prolipoprotein diacylglyceryl transferase [Alphaproteobacteria bacterium]
MYQAVLPFPQIDPVLIQIGPFAIRWYALAYIAGLLLGWWYVVKLVKERKLWKAAPFHNQAPATPDQVGDLLLWIAIGVILGGRLGYVLFYGTFFCGIWEGAACEGLPQAYLDNPLKIVAAWEGGMSFHGGLLGVVIALVLFCRRKKLNVISVGDLAAAATPIGLFFGRIANFINGELWGKETAVPWAMVFPNAPGGPRHPSQLYEAFLEGIVLFLVLRFAMYRWQIHKKRGLVIAWFLAGYGAARFFVEFFRDSESKLYDWFSMGQLLSLPMWAAAAFFFWYAYRRSAKPA